MVIRVLWLNPGLIFEMGEFIDQHEYYDLKRDGRFLIAELLAPHQVLSTSAYRGGLCERIRYLVNHQSCEGNGHDARFALIVQLGEVGYHRHVCEERGLPPDAVALMGTAANMNYAARVVDTHAELRVCAVVTAGVEGNAGCAGDADDPEGGQPEDMRRMCVFVIVTCLLATGLAVLLTF